MRDERYEGEPDWRVRQVKVAILKWMRCFNKEPMKFDESGRGW